MFVLVYLLIRSPPYDLEPSIDNYDLDLRAAYNICLIFGLRLLEISHYKGKRTAQESFPATRLIFLASPSMWLGRTHNKSWSADIPAGETGRAGLKLFLHPNYFYTPDFFYHPKNCIPLNFDPVLKRLMYLLLGSKSANFPSAAYFSSLEIRTFNRVYETEGRL